MDSHRVHPVNEVVVEDDATGLAFLPASASANTGLVFICGSGIAADAYAPLPRPVAEERYRVFVMKLPYRFAPRDSDKQAAIGRAREAIAAHPEVERRVIAGHSLGGILLLANAHLFRLHV